MLPLLILLFVGGLRALDLEASEGIGDTEEVLQCSQANSYHIMLIGETGVGKSTFGNYILGLNASEGFEVGVGADSVTVTTETLTGYFLGDKTNLCISVTDTPGLGDTQCRDEKHMRGIVKTIMDVKKVDLFILIFKGTAPRFHTGSQSMIQMFQKLFGNDLYSSMIIQFTFFRHDQRSRLLREMANLTMTGKSKSWNDQFKLRLNLTHDIPTTFIDPLYMPALADSVEKSTQEAEITKLHGLMRAEMEYVCSDDCLELMKLWYKMRYPIIHSSELVKVKPGSQVYLRCSIWLQSYCSPTVQNKDLSLSWVIYANSSEQPIDVEVMGNFSIEYFNELTVETSILSFNMNDATEGRYTCKYANASSQSVSSEMILGPKEDGYLTSWSEWSECFWRNGTSLKKRHRHCILPKNRGAPCSGTVEEEQPCNNVEFSDAENCFNKGYSWDNTYVTDIIRNNMDQFTCLSNCLENPKCMVYTWLKADLTEPTNVCKLFSSIGVSVPSDGISGSRDCLCSVNKACKISKDKSISPIFSISTPTERMCKQLCKKSPDCSEYTWYDETSFAKFQCYLYADCEEELEECTDCHTGSPDCANTCTGLQIHTFSESSRNLQNKVFSDHDCDRLKNQGTSTIWYKFSGQAGTRLPTCDQVDSYMVNMVNMANHYSQYDQREVFCILGEHHISSQILYRKPFYYKRFKGSTTAMNINISIRKCGDEYIYGIPATSCPSNVQIKIMGI